MAYRALPAGEAARVEPLGLSSRCAVSGASFAGCGQKCGSASSPVRRCGYCDSKYAVEPRNATGWRAPADEWDTDLRGSVREHNAASQALEDAIAVRELLFSVLSEVSSAEFHVYRTAAMAAPELIIAGTVTREEEAGPDTHSLAMRAKLCGFHFSLNDGGLQALELGKRQPLA